MDESTASQPINSVTCHRQAVKTGRDSFLLGPSGAGFLHPSTIDAQDPLLQHFVNKTLDALDLLGASAFVLWDQSDNRLNSSSALLEVRFAMLQMLLWQECLLCLSGAMHDAGSFGNACRHCCSSMAA